MRCTISREVPPAELYGSHIRDSIEIGHAERIGHGLDIAYERNAPALLAEMARRHILVEGYGLDYLTLKRFARASLEHAFLPGASLWRAPDAFMPVSACADETMSRPAHSVACRAFLARNEPAALQWR